MHDYVEREHVVNVPRAAGVEGYVIAVREVLTALPRVAGMQMDDKGVIRVRYWEHAGEDSSSSFQIDFSSAQPYYIIRNSNVIDMGYCEDENPLTCLARMFCSADAAHMRCISVVVGSNLVFNTWCKRSGVTFSDSVFGIPLMVDKDVEEDVVVLCCGYGPTARMNDVKRSYKLTFPKTV